MIKKILLITITLLFISQPCYADTYRMIMNSQTNKNDWITATISPDSILLGTEGNQRVLFNISGVISNDPDFIYNPASNNLTLSNSGTATFPTVNFGSTTGVSATATNGVLTLAGIGGTYNGKLTFNFEQQYYAALISADGPGTYDSITWNANVGWKDDKSFILGDSSDSWFQWDTAETNDSLKTGLICNSVNSSGNYLLCEFGDINTNFGVPQVVDPHLRIQSADATSTSDFIQFYHDQTNACLESGTGTIVSAYASALTNTTNEFLRLTHSTSGVSAANYGISLTNYLEDASGNTPEIATSIDSIWTVATAGSEDSAIVLKGITDGGAITEWQRLVNGSIEWTLGNVTYVPIGGDIETYVTNATAGDTLILAAGTYTITGDIDIGKAITIQGQGIGQTIITYTSITNDQVFYISANNVVIKDMSININHSTSTVGSAGVLFDGTGGTCLSGGLIERCSITTTSSSADSYSIRFSDSSGTVNKCFLNSTTSASKNSYGVFHINVSTAEITTTVNVYDTYSSTSSNGGTNSVSFLSADSSATQDNFLYLYRCNGIGTGTATNEAGARTTGGDAFLYAYNCIFQGDDYDVIDATSALLQLSNTTLVNGTVSGTITLNGYDVCNYMGVGTTDFDGTPATGQLVVKGTTADGTTNILVGRDSAEANVLTVNTDGLVNLYNSIATVSNGVPAERATIDLTGQTAAKGVTTIYTPTASGMFRISIALQVTTAATTSSVLGGATGVVITYTEPDGSVAQSIAPLLTSQAGAVIVPATGNIGNTTTTQSQGSAIIYAKTGVAIQYAIGYTSVGATPMAYSAHLKLEAM